MSYNNPYAAYQKTQTVTANQNKLIIMLHDGAIRFLAQAASAIKNEDYYNKAVLFNKTNKIISQLWGSLDHERGGEIASNLAGIYAYVTRRLNEANVSNDTGAIKEVMSLLREIRDGWEQAERVAPAAAPSESSPSAKESLQVAA
jgi:flagellar protein FliS